MGPGHGVADRAARWSRLLDLCDRAIPLSERVQRFVREEHPDVVLVTPHLMPASTDVHYARSAGATGVPTAICVASWDNLSSKQLLRVVPDLVTVWNDTQKEEATGLHGVPADRVVSTGAQCFDHWFGWQPRPREQFCARVGLDPSKPYIVYLGGALFPTTMIEADYCRRWIEAVRASDEPALRTAGILVRPHPKRVEEWRTRDFSDFEGVVVWPENVDFPAEQATRADYFDSIHHSAVAFGINTTAMIEAGIIGKAVHTITVPEFAASGISRATCARWRRLVGGSDRSRSASGGSGTSSPAATPRARRPRAGSPSCSSGRTASRCRRPPSSSTRSSNSWSAGRASGSRMRRGSCSCARRSP